MNKCDEPKKGYESLSASYRYWAEREPGRAQEWKKKFDWALERAQQYADRLGVDREKVLEAWESDRDYWYVNYYQESNQPSLEGKNVVTLAEWEAEGERLYGKERLEWKFRCPACGNVQTARMFKDAGKDPHLCYINCASRYGLGGRKDCKWTTGGLLNIGGRYVIDKKFVPRLIFEFADKENMIYGV
ncbi:MAG: hypothetical protein J5732_02850 [Bacteroidaceae bacterium]|nr:hypothetical protein [Bacteroidaceae bacterium]